MKASILFLSLSLVPLQVMAQSHGLDWDPTTPVLIGAQKRVKPLVPLQLRAQSYGVDSQLDLTEYNIKPHEQRSKWNSRKYPRNDETQPLERRAQMNNTKAYCELGHSVGNLIGMLLGGSSNADSSYCQTYGTPTYEPPISYPIQYRNPVPQPIIMQQPMPLFIEHSISPQDRNQQLIKESMRSFRPGRAVN